MKDVKITCKDCGKEFTVSEQEQKWYKDKEFDLPKRCPDCRKSKRSSRKKQTMNKPLYEPGNVIDFRFTREHMPDRVYVSMVYRMVMSDEWMYQCWSEKSGIKVYLSETEISKRKSKKSAKCYEHPIVKDMMSKGFRFCGNSKSGTAINRAKKLHDAGYIKHIVLKDAVDEDGNMIDGSLGLWVQYQHTIDDEPVLIPREDGGYTVK